jgi:amino acid transporter
MSSTPRVDAEAEMIEGLGYEPVLSRVMGAVRATMVNISTSSVTTAIFTLFAYGLLIGGTSFVWTWAIGFGILLLVTLVFAELGSSMPLAGALYQWASRLVGPRYGYFVGWLYAASQVAIVAAVCFAIAPIVASMFDEVLTTNQQVTWGLGILAFCTVINVIGIKLTSTLASAGAIAEVTAMVGLTILLLVVGFGNQDADIVFRGDALPPGSEFLPVALAAMLFGSWPYTGLEMTTDMAEETKDAPRVIPRAAVTSLVTTFAVGMVFLLAAVWAIPDLATALGAPVPLQYIIEGTLSTTIYKIFLVFVIVAVFVCTIANQALTSRIVFSLARDGKFPAPKLLQRVPDSTRTPIAATILVAILSGIVIINTDGIAIIAVAALSALFFAYQMVVWPATFKRLSGRWQPSGWSLGSWAPAVYIGAMVLGTGLLVNIAWPRGEDVWYNKWSGVVFIAASLIVALLYYLFSGRKSRERIDMHLPHAPGFTEAGGIESDATPIPSGAVVGKG